MAGEYTISQANGFLKPVFGKKLLQLLPEAAYFQKNYKLSDDVPRVGLDYEVPVALKMPHGHSFNGSAGGVVALNGPLAGKTENAKVPPFEYILRDQVSNGLLDRAAAEGEAAFGSAVEFVGKMMTLSARNILEIQCLHGQEGIGTVGAAVAGQVITVDAETFSPGIFSILEGSVLDCYQSDLTTLRQGSLTVSAVNIDTREITVVGTATGITTGDVLYFKGANSAGTFNEMVGLGKQLAEQTASVFNITKSTYSLWRAKVNASVGEFSPSALVKAATDTQNRGFASGEMRAIMAPRAWGVLNSALAVSEVFNGGAASMKKTGADEIEIRANGVRITCVSHPFQKEGRCYLLPAEWIRRVGAVDLTYSKAGTQDQFLEPVPGYNAMELQARANWQIFLEKPSQSVLLKGITYS